MTAKNQVYLCELCGNVAEVLRAGDGSLICCGKPMVLQTENTTDAAVEKHVPVVERADGQVRVAVGSVPHPMEEAHYIEWIELQSGDMVNRVYLSPGNEPVACFTCPDDAEITVRAYCNLHGLWKA